MLRVTCISDMAVTTTPLAYELFKEANQAVLDILCDPVTEKSFQGRSYTLQNLGLLKKIRDSLRKEAESEGQLPTNLRSSKLGVTQLMEWDIRGFVR
jgi:hypothetical protein